LIVIALSTIDTSTNGAYYNGAPAVYPGFYPQAPYVPLAFSFRMTASAAFFIARH
jgi:hypothetical protein